MNYKGYTITKTGYKYPVYEFVHGEYDGAPETYFSESEQTPSSDNRCGSSDTIEDAKQQIDELEIDNTTEVETVIDVFKELGSYFKPH